MKTYDEVETNVDWTRQFGGIEQPFNHWLDLCIQWILETDWDVAVGYRCF